jgi:MoxR-like ATPase
MLEQQVYIADAAVATALYLSMALGKPLLIEGPAGVGKTEIAKALANALDTKLIRLQCYEGLDATTALYEWNYPKQLLHLKLEESSSASEAEKEAAIFGEAFLLKRPLLQAITENDRAPVLLIDEIDRSDEEFEAFLLEVLSDFQVTIPDALRRRCLYHWIDYPTLEKELEIVRAKVPAIDEQLSQQLTSVVQRTRSMGLSKIPGLAETLDWANALVALQATELNDEIMAETVGCFLKDETDIATFYATKEHK